MKSAKQMGNKTFFTINKKFQLLQQREGSALFDVYSNSLDMVIGMANITTKQISFSTTTLFNIDQVNEITKAIEMIHENFQF